MIRAPLLVGLLLGTAAAVPGIPALSEAVPLRPWHLLVLVAVLVAYLSQPSGTLRRYYILSPEVALIAYVLGSTITEFVNGESLGLMIDYPSLMSPLFYVMAYLSVRLVVSDSDSFRSLLQGLVVGAPITGIVAVSQAVGLPGVNEAVLSLVPGEGAIDRHLEGEVTRATAFVGHWTGLGSYLSCCVAVLCILVLLEQKNGGRYTNLLLLALTVTLGGVASTLTISAILTSVVVILISMRLSGYTFRYLLGLVPLTVAAVVILWPSLVFRLEEQTLQSSESVFQLPGWVPSTLTYRLGIWVTETIPAIMERPLLGWGQDAYALPLVGETKSIRLVWHSAESQWLGLLVSFGIPTFILYVCVVLALSRWFYQMHRSRLNEFVPLLVLFVMLLGASFTAPVLTNRGAPGILWPLLGACIALLISRQKTLDVFGTMSPEPKSNDVSSSANLNK